MKVHYLTIGEVAKLSNISIQTLRFYDRIDLFKPIKIDPKNQYRYYQNTQLYYLDIIKSLKYLGLSLEEVKSVLTLTPDELVNFLAEQENRINEEFRRLIETKEVLKRKKEQMQSFVVESTRMNVCVKKMPVQKIVKIKTSNISINDIPNKEYGLMSKVLEDMGSVFDTLYGGAYSLNRYESLDDIHYDYLFTHIVTDKAIEVDLEDVEISSIPEGTYLSITFALKDDAYEICYQKLMDYIDQHQTKIEPIVYDVWMPINFAASNEDEFLIELKIQIQAT